MGVVDDPPMRLMSLLPKDCRLFSNVDTLSAGQAAPLAPGTASDPGKAMYRTSVLEYPLLPFMEVPKQSVAREIEASPTMALGPSSPLVSPQTPKY